MRPPWIERFTAASAYLEGAAPSAPGLLAVTPAPTARRPPGATNQAQHEMSDHTQRGARRGDGTDRPRHDVRAAAARTAAALRLLAQRQSDACGVGGLPRRPGGRH